MKSPSGGIDYGIVSMDNRIKERSYDFIEGLKKGIFKIGGEGSLSFCLSFPLPFSRKFGSSRNKEEGAD